MRTRLVALVTALAVVSLTACSGGVEPAAAPAATVEASIVTSTTVAMEGTDPLGGLPEVVVAGVAALMMGTSLETLPPEEIAADILEGCVAAVEITDAEQFMTAVIGIVTDRMARAGDPPNGEVAARYGQALGAAFSEACPDEFGEALVAANEEVEVVEPADAAASALEALAIGLEGSPFEGMLEGEWPAGEVVPVIEEVCRIADEGGSNIDIVDFVVAEVLLRFDPEQGDLDLLTIAIVTVAVVFLCPQHTDTVLGP